MVVRRLSLVSSRNFSGSRASARSNCSWISALRYSAAPSASCAVLLETNIDASLLASSAIVGVQAVLRGQRRDELRRRLRHVGREHLLEFFIVQKSFLFQTLLLRLINLLTAQLLDRLAHADGGLGAVFLTHQQRGTEATIRDRVLFLAEILDDAVGKIAGHLLADFRLQLLEVVERLLHLLRIDGALRDNSASHRIKHIGLGITAAHLLHGLAITDGIRLGVLEALAELARQCEPTPLRTAEAPRRL